jgi:hypothetical protein
MRPALQPRRWLSSRLLVSFAADLEVEWIARGFVFDQSWFFNLHAREFNKIQISWIYFLKYPNFWLLYAATEIRRQCATLNWKEKCFHYSHRKYPLTGQVIEA